MIIYGKMELAGLLPPVMPESRNAIAPSGLATSGDRYGHQLERVYLRSRRHVCFRSLLQARSHFRDLPMDSVGANHVYRPGAHQYNNIGRNPKNNTPVKFHALEREIQSLTQSSKYYQSTCKRLTDKLQRMGEHCILVYKLLCLGPLEKVLATPQKNFKRQV